MSEVKYRFWLEPIGSAANEEVAKQINNLGDSAFTCEDQSIVVDGKKVYGVYLVPHTLLTKFGHSVHKPNLRAYVQAGEGETREYANFRKIGRSNLADTNPVQIAQEAIDKLGKRKYK